MRLAYVVNQYPPNITSGLGRYVEEITPHLATRHQLDVYTLNDGHQTVLAHDGPVTVHRPVGRVLGAIARRRRLNRTRRIDFALLVLTVLVNNLRYLRPLRRSRPDLVVLHDTTNFLCGLACHYLWRLPIVLHVHTTEYGVAPRRTIRDPLRLFPAIERWLARISRRVVVPTPEVRAQLVAGGWDEATIDVVPLGGTFERLLADPAFDRAALRARAAARRAALGLPEQAPVVLFVGRLEHPKGVYTLLDALPRLVERVPTVRLLMVGEGDDGGLLRRAADAGVAEHLWLSRRFVDRAELLEYYELADVCVFPSVYEPFGLVATEAMAMGRATVLGDGFSRVFQGDPDRPAVRYARAGDPEDLAAALAELCDSPQRRQALADRAVELTRRDLSWGSAAAATAAVYEGTVATSPAEQVIL